VLQVSVLRLELGVGFVGLVRGVVGA
jgi:hypothetical protein